MKPKRLLPLLAAALALFIAANIAAAAQPTPNNTVLDAIAKLEKAEVLTADQAAYFRQTAVKGRTADGQKAAALVIAAAKKLGCTDDTLEASVNHLAKLKIIGVTKSWIENTAPDKKIAGGMLEIVIPRIADKIN